MPDVPEPLRTALRGRYDLQDELGRGGMATVYLAHDVRHNRPVAVKVLHDAVTSVVSRARFFREIELAARLTHPHILPLLDSGETDGFLYYVMPYVRGESLAERIAREHQLPVRDIVAIVGEAAAALAYAHEQGVLHRDIKPANILLSEGSAYVADFGIARAIERSAGTDKLTETGVTPGTPAYMSPEQATGTADLDGRSDLYSLACTAYEMLVGEPPFTGPTAQAVLARHIYDPVPPVHTVRPSVPPALEQAVMRALDKVPADRFATTTEFAEALTAAPLPTAERPRVRSIGHRALLVAAALVAGLVIWWLWPTPAPPLDATRFAILPPRYAPNVSLHDEQQALEDAFRRWQGITVVDAFRVADAVSEQGGVDLSPEDARRVARRLGAGRYVRTEVSSSGDSIRVYSVLYDATAAGRMLDAAAVRLDSTRTQMAGHLAVLVDSLLFGDLLGDVPADDARGTASYPARRAYLLGRRAVLTWDLATADSSFAAATREDALYAQASVWLARVRAWNRAPAAAWRSAAERAAAGRDRLQPADRRAADALVLLGQQDFARACALWDASTRAAPGDFTAWYSLASCLSRDEAVLPDRASPSGWRFRASYHRATAAYQRAFQLLPSIHKALSGDSYGSVRRLLMTSGSALRIGRGPAPQATTFLAYPSWLGDTLAFVPYPAEDFQRADARVVPATRAVAVRRQREAFHEIAISWAVAFPRSADAMLALAVSLDLLGDESALDTLRVARDLVADDEERMRVAASQVWTTLKYALPADTVAIRAARALADSLLREDPAASPYPGLLASLATLTGRAVRASQLSRRAHATDPWSWDLPAPIAHTAPALLAFSALGGPLDSIRALAGRVDSAITSELAPDQQAAARRVWLARAASLAFEQYRFPSLQRLATAGHPIVDAQEAVSRGDTTRAREIFDQLRRARRSIGPADLTLDALYPEAALLTELGDTVGAIGWLDPSLASLRATQPEVLADVAVAAGLVRAMVLRAGLAAGVGDTATARRWAVAVTILWTGADGFLQPTVERMTTLATGD